MLALTRHCSFKALLPRTIAFAKTQSIQNGLQQFRVHNHWTSQFFKAKPNFLRNNTTTAVNQVVQVSSKTDKKKVGYWLLGCSGMVFVAVVLGGVTRLTESGLSMVTWKLFGEKMPKTEDEWKQEFEKYKEYPEFKLKNSEITLKDFKWIWHMEYGHRMWGRLIGAAYFIPATYFWMSGKLSKPMKIRVAVFGGFLAAQGLLGWYMVKSGLEDRFHGESDVPRVSQYRLVAHLSLALALFSGLFRSSLACLLPPEKLQIDNRNVLRASKKFRMLAHYCKGFVFFTAVSGAFVAGLDAGLVYNSFPKMADKWIPSDILAYKPTISNFTENPTTVQFDHRVLGTTTLTMISILYLLSRKRVLPRRAYTATTIFAAVAWMQVALGITTLLTYVPVPVAAAHQSGSLVLLSTALWLTHELKKLPK